MSHDVSLDPYPDDLPSQTDFLDDDHHHDPFDPARYSTYLRALNHRPTKDGRCLHLWRNRTTRVVDCPFLDGFRAALSAPPDMTEAEIERAQLIFDIDHMSMEDD